MKSLIKQSLANQSGSALLIILALILAVFSTSLTALLPALNRDTKAAASNALVLAQAKAALVAYAVSAGSTSCSAGSIPDCSRPGDLPCPDATPDNAANNGIAATSCGSATAITAQTSRLGRLPWKTLGLPDLRDASGNRLWYALSDNFKNINRRIPLNSNTRGTITLRNSNGSVSNDGSNPGGTVPGGVVAVIIAPGEAITRQDGHPQNRGNNAALEYLDIATVNGITEDNATFVDNSASNGFIQGPIKDAQGNLISNDQMVFITYEEIMPLIEKRVAAEALYALTNSSTEMMSGIPAFPYPALSTDITCTPTTPSRILNNTDCQASNTPIACGLLPVNTATGLQIWSNTAVPRGTAGGTNSWFQINGWRALAIYAFPGCTALPAGTPASFNHAVAIKNTVAAQ